MFAASSAIASRARIIAATAIIALGALSALGGPWQGVSANDAGFGSLLAHSFAAER